LRSGHGDIGHGWTVVEVGSSEKVEKCIRRGHRGIVEWRLVGLGIGGLKTLLQVEIMR
jgi:hypothetical protein